MDGVKVLSISYTERLILLPCSFSWGGGGESTSTKHTRITMTNLRSTHYTITIEDFLSYRDH